ncbi:uncharacterized protein [Numenius arquata]|uniref:uncharacterized protein n=1 Tax=Numenius arquata TaxID=31919 RepID=UPI003D30476C
MVGTPRQAWPPPQRLSPPAAPAAPAPAAPEAARSACHPSLLPAGTTQPAPATRRPGRPAGACGAAGGGGARVPRGANGRLTVAAGASALWWGCEGPARLRQGRQRLPPLPGVLPSPRPPEATARQRVGAGAGWGASSPSEPAPPARPSRPGAALTADVAYLSLELPSPMHPRATEWICVTPSKLWDPVAFGWRGPGAFGQKSSLGLFHEITR